MTIQERVNEEWKTAMKARDPKKTVLALIKTSLKDAAISSGGDRAGVTDEVALSVLTKMAKQRRESVAEYEKADRKDLAEKESFELAVISEYLPKQLSDDELTAMVKTAVETSGASSMKEMGKVMGAVMSAVGSRADGKRVQAAVKAALG